MQASRVLRFSSAKVGLLPPRSSWDIFKSAGNGTLSIVMSPEKRDNFVKTVNTGTISPDVLYQADHGAAMVLALYNDLNSPLMTKYKFDAGEFCEGVKPALEHFHNIQAKLENALFASTANQSTGKDTEEKKDSDGTLGKIVSEKDADVPVGEKGTSKKDEELAREMKLALSGSFQEDQLERLLKVKGSDMGNFLEQSWTKQADEDPDSPAGQLRSMVTDDYFEYIQALSETNFVLNGGNREVLYEEDSSKIKNVALLSARAMAIDPSEEKTKVEDDELKMKEEEVDEENIAVAAQVEVLYDIQQTFKALDAEKKSEKHEGEESSVTKSNVWVAVFESWLNGNPDGSSDLRWKLVVNRQAWEFPLLNNTTNELTEK